MSSVTATAQGIFNVERGAPSLPSESSEPSPQPTVERGLFRRLAKYFNPGDGPVDCFRAVENITAYGSYLSFSASTQDVLSRVRGGADLFGSALSIPKFFKNISDLKKYAVRWLKAPEKNCFKKLFYEFFNAINTASQAALCLNNAKIIDLKTRIPLVNGLNQVTAIITDGMSLHKVIRNEKNEDKTIRMLKIAKYTSSVAIAVIVLLGIFYTALLQQVAFAVLVLSTIFVVSSILSGVLEKEAGSKTFSFKPVTIKN